MSSKGKVTMEWVDSPKGRCVKFIYENQFDSSLAKKIIGQMKQAFSVQLLPDEKAVMICDCTQMTSMDDDAKEIWGRALVEVKEHIDEIWVMTGKKSVKDAAERLKLLTGFNVKIVDPDTNIALD